jgi:hypothetical protein
MPRFEVLRDTIDSASGRIYKAGEIMVLDELPLVVERDVEGRPVLGADGKPKTKPMGIAGNLRQIDETKGVKSADEPKGFRAADEPRGKPPDEPLPLHQEPKKGK